MFSCIGSLVFFIKGLVSFTFILVNLLFLSLVVFLWFKDVLRERLIGYHNHKLELSLRIGILLFILSEVFFFVSFFWAYFDSSVSPVVDIGMQWPPKGIIPLSVYSVPLLNTVILLRRGVSVTWAHHSITNNFYKKSLVAITITVLLGIYFLLIQYVEYCEARFSFSDGSYGRTFFLATGFHGFHVLVGTTFLFFVTLFILKGYELSNHHFCFEAAAWYWHFVDVVWLFLFLSIYWWGSL